MRSGVDRVAPELEAAVDDVDRSLLREALALAPLERARACSQATAALGRFHRVTP